MLEFNLDGNTLNSYWLLKYFRLKHPGIVAAIERTGKTRVTLDHVSLPRLRFEFDILEDELTEEEAKSFDRQVDTDKVCKVLDWQILEGAPGKLCFDSDTMEWVEDIMFKPPSEITG